MTADTRDGKPKSALVLVSPEWQVTADHPVTALDTDGRTVYAALTSGEVLALDALDGTVRRRAYGRSTAPRPSPSP